MVKQIHAEVLELNSNEYLGLWPRESDYDLYINYDADIIVDGKVVLTFRRAALKSLLSPNLTEDGYKYWQWVSKALYSDQRGNAAGKEIVTNPEIHTTVGQDEFFRQASKGKITTLEEARALVASDTALSRNTYYVGKTEKDGLVDTDEIERWDSLVRKKSTPPELKVEAIAKRNAAKLAWFDKWLETVWAVADDKAKAAKEGKKRYVTGQPRANKCYSNIVGAFDRSGRIPYGRLSKSTLDRYDEFASFAHFYQEVDQTLKETMPEQHAYLYEKFSKVKDPRYNLFGTAFTTLTVNNNFQTAYHRDGNNCEGGIAVLSAITRGTYDGFGLVFPELRVAFDIRDGDFLAGDNQGFIHGQIPMTNASPDAESIWFVFYSRERMVMLDSMECEECRKSFMAYCSENYRETHGTGEPKWNGIFEGMWTSEEWKTYKSEHCPEASNTNYWGT